LSEQDSPFDRQLCLREVGAAGQRRIQSSRLDVSNSVSGSIEALYLTRAGVGGVRRVDGPDEAFKHEHAFRHASALSFGAGAWRALRQLKRVLEA
jgi:hypothetical protein